jgi:hypothetical protein
MTVERSVRQGARLVPQTPARILVIAIDELAGRDAVGELLDRLGGGELPEVMVISPGAEKTPFRRTRDAVDGATTPGWRLEVSLEELGRAGIPALGEVGDGDPLLAAREALRRFPAEEVLIVAAAESQSRWLEGGVLERLWEELPSAVRVIAVQHGD